MSEAPPEPARSEHRPEPPDLPLRPERRGLIERLSIVWLIPIGALAIALGVAWQNWTDRGPLIQIAFDSASGIKQGETELHYRDVAVGVVEEVGFSAELAKVLVGVRLAKGIAAYVDDRSIFWIVQPEVTTRGVTGLGTVLSGVYIEGVWDDVPGGLAYNHIGQPRPPLLRAGEEGIVIQLRSTESVSLVQGTPILYKGIEVGQIGAPQLAAGGTAALAEAVIRAPYAGLLRSTTRFWDTSGFTFTLGAQGAELDFTSLASLISGGVAFETVASGGQSAQAGTTFSVFPDEATARASFFSEGAGPPVNLTVLFDENVAGLATGSPVAYGGVVIGEVTNLTGIVDPQAFGDERVRLLATLSIRPARLGIEGDEQAALEFLAQRVAEGLRAQLQTASILTGGLRIELTEVPDAPPAEIDLAALPFPRIPATDSAISDVSATAEGVFQRLNALPIEALIQAAIGFLDAATTLVADGDLRQVPVEAMGLLADVRGIIGSEELQALPADVGALIEDLRGATGDLRAVVAQVREADLATRLAAAVASATVAADTVTAALAGAPELLTSLTANAERLRSLPIEPLLARLTELADAAEAVVASDDTQAMPGELRALVTDTRGAADDLRALFARVEEAQAVTRILDTVDAAAAAARGIETGVAGAPELIERLTAVAATAESLPLDRLVAEATGLATSAGTLLGSPEAQALPADLRVLLADLRDIAANVEGLTTSLTEEQAVSRLLAAADAAAAAARSVEASTAGAAELIERLTAVAGMAQSLPLDQLVSEVTALATSADALLGSPEAQALPADLRVLLAELGDVAANVEGLTASLTEEQAVSRLLAAVDSAQAAAASVEAGTAGVPALVARLDAIAARAEAVPLDTLAADLDAVLTAANGLLAQDSTRALPASLNGALDEVRAALAELRAGGTVENANRALASASDAATAVEEFARQLPALVERISGLLVTANSTIAGFGKNSQVSRGAQAALREVERAAEAVQSLARALERRPNSLLLGR